eukprot:c6802_g1_i1 orf=45-212(-)
MKALPEQARLHNSGMLGGIITKEWKEGFSEVGKSTVTLPHFLQASMDIAKRNDSS